VWVPVETGPLRGEGGKCHFYEAKASFACACHTDKIYLLWEAYSHSLMFWVGVTGECMYGSFLRDPSIAKLNIRTRRTLAAFTVKTKLPP